MHLETRTAPAGAPGSPSTRETRAAATAARGDRAMRRRRNLIALLFCAPAIIVFGLFSWWPIAHSVVMAFQKNNLVTPAQWVGLSNFHHLLADPQLGTAVRNSLWFTVLALAIGFPLPLALAVVMSTLRRRAGWYRFAVYLPVVMPPAVAVLLWKWFYDPDAGLFNQALKLVGLGPWPWLQSRSWAMPSLVLEATWAGFGGTCLIYAAALAAVPGELYEAAQIDGAGIPRRIWHVTLPQLRGTLLVLLLLQVTGTLQVFIEPFVMTDGGPDNATLTILLLIYRYAFVDGDFGMAAAASVLLAAVLAVLSALYLRATRRWST